MKTFLSLLKPQLFLLAFGLLTFASVANMSCTPRYSQEAIDSAKNLKTALTDLMGKASTSPYSKNTAAITKVQESLNKAVSQAEGIRNNAEIAKAWKTLAEGLVAPFLAKWKEKETLSAAFVKEATDQVTKSLDTILKAEMGKKK